MRVRFRDTTYFLLELNIVLAAPFLIALINFSDNYRVLTYSIISIAIILYIISDQFFHFSRKFDDVVRSSLGIALLNLVFLGLLSLTGIFSSPFFFIIYILLMVTALATDERVTVMETLSVTLFLFLSEYQLNEGFQNLSLESSSIPFANLFSIFFFSPLAIAIASYFRRLRQKEETLNELRLILAEEESEDEILLDKIEEGIFVLDKARKVVKISRSAEQLLNISARYVLGERFFNVISFLDPITLLPLGPQSTFFQNLLSNSPKDLRWEVAHKNEYGTVRHFMLEQRPLFDSDKELDGFLIFMTEKAKGGIAELVKKFNEFLFVRLSSIVSLITFSRSKANPQSFDKTSEYLKLFIDTLNSANLYRRIEDKEYAVNLSEFSFRKAVEGVVKAHEKGIKLLTDKNLEASDLLMIESDERLLNIAITNLIKGARLIDSSEGVTVTPRRDVTSRRVQLKVNIAAPKVHKEKFQVLTKPFYQGDVDVLNTIGGSGLELAIATSLFQYMSIEFLLEVSEESLSLVVTFKK